MDKINDTLIASTFQKVKDVDIFSLKAYMEQTNEMSVGTELQVTLTHIFVNFPFFLLNLIVGFFSIILRFFENFSLYDAYKQTVFNTSKNLWQNISGSGNYSNSLLYLLIALSAFSIFISFIFSKGDFSKRLIHLFLVILLGLGYFGSVQSTSGGVYILDTVHNVANSFSSSVTHLTITDPDNSKQKLSQKTSVADDYIMKTSYTAYLFVNTGQLNGKYHNNQTDKDENLDNQKILGEYDKNGKFITPKSNKILDYTDYLGDGALKGNERNRWVSAVSDYLWLKSIYVILKIIEAVIIAIPLLLIQLIAFLADVVVILLMFLFPLALLISFLPKMQHVVFNVLKVMFGAVSFPALTGFLTLIVFYIQSMIANFIKSKFTNDSLVGSSNLKGQSILFMLFITIVVQGLVFWQLWKHKEKFLTLVLGSQLAQSVNHTVDMIADKANSVGMSPQNMYEKAQDLSGIAMMGAGFGAGTLLNAQDNWNALKEDRRKDNETELDYDNNEVSDNFVASQNDPVYENDLDLSEISDDTDIENQVFLSKDYDKAILIDDKNSDVSDNVLESGGFEEIDYRSGQSSIEQEKNDSNYQKPEQAFDVETEYERLKRQKLSSFKNRKVNRSETELTHFSSDNDYFKAHGQNAFQKGFNASKSKDVRLKHNLNRKSEILDELARLRGDV
ncbi:hypothetical protein N1496_07330 [Streptococcus didelphis]|uniref:Conjugal transfer protein n=1 Tax=Streptococcus didelphis TaxID=102886 RepID=A0ABY9LI69_9STRE|nr:hypothetical protein [Streptococcus didelphis]WMB27855.1 hypothetical protein N1496_07330 [Streptococcus didelphis]